MRGYKTITKKRLFHTAFCMAALIKVPKEKAKRNRAFNRTLERHGCMEHSISGCINGQRIGQVADFRYGLCRYANVGCEIIAAYNTLCLLGRQPSLRPTMSDLSYRFETSGGQMLLGAWGTNPFAIEKVMTAHGVKLQRFESFASLSAEENHSVIILSFWNRKGNIFGGIHTVAVEHTDEKYIVYNRFDTMPSPLMYDSLEAAIGNGELIVGYIATVY